MRQQKHEFQRDRKGGVNEFLAGELAVRLWTAGQVRRREVIRPEDEGALAAIEQHGPARMLEIGAPLGVVSLAAAQNELCSEVVVVATRADLMASIERTLAATTTERLRVVQGSAPLDAAGEPFDAVIVHQQPSRRLTETWLRQAASMLSGGGALVVCGHAKSGVRVSEELLAELSSAVETVEVGEGVRIVVGTGPFSGSAEPAPVSEHEAEIRDVSVRWATTPGVFSEDELDPATRLLLETVTLPHSGRILDLGCGAGVIGLWCARRMPGVTVTMTDVSVPAVECAKRSAALNDLPDVEIALGDGLSAFGRRRFDVVLTNPPVHSHGKQDHEITKQFVRWAIQAIGRKGRLWLVTAPTTPVRPLLAEQFTEVRIAADVGPFRVYDAIRRPRRQGDQDAW